MGNPISLYAYISIYPFLFLSTPYFSVPKSLYPEISLDNTISLNSHIYIDYPYLCISLSVQLFTNSYLSIHIPLPLFLYLYITISPWTTLSLFPLSHSGKVAITGQNATTDYDILFVNIPQVLRPKPSMSVVSYCHAYIEVSIKKRNSSVRRIHRKYLFPTALKQSEFPMKQSEVLPTTDKQKRCKMEAAIQKCPQRIRTPSYRLHKVHEHFLFF